MPRQLILMRHGHADDHSDDFQRPLNDVGRAAARRAGETLAAARLAPAHILSSTAPRALQTAELVAGACQHREAIQAERALYLASAPRYLSCLHGLPERLSRVLVVGHNPDLSGLARRLGWDGGSLSPAEYVLLELEIEAWSELGA